MTIRVALDQNMWSDLARSRDNPKKFSTEFEVLRFLSSALDANEIEVPLTQSNIFETEKLGSARSRAARANLLATMSKGRVYKGLDFRRAIEIQSVLKQHFDVDPAKLTKPNLISKKFWEATSVFALTVPANISELAQNNPQLALFDYLSNADDDVRRMALKHYKEGMAEVLSTINCNSANIGNESLSLRRKIMSAQIWMDTQDHFWKEVVRLGIPLAVFRNAQPTIIKDMVRKVPSLLILRELCLVRGAEVGAFNENDLRDIDFLCTVLPYADIVAAEKAFVSRSRQAKLDDRFDISIVVDLADLPGAIRSRGNR